MIRRIVQAIKGLIVTSTNVPTLTCAQCGKTFRYYSVDNYNGECLCRECQRTFKGGPYDGMKVGDIYDN